MKTESLSKNLQLMQFGYSGSKQEYGVKTFELMCGTHNHRRNNSDGYMCFKDVASV